VAVDAGSVYSSIRIRLDQLDNDLKGVYARLGQLESKLGDVPIKSQPKWKSFFSFLSSSGIGSFLGLGAAIAGVTAYAKKAEAAWEEQTIAIAKLNTVLKSTGADAWTSSDALQDMASSLQKTTLYGDETITSMQAVLLGFRSIKGDNFEEATKAILDMSTVMKQDLQSSAQQVGKALDDPIGGITALSRVGFVFTEQQKAMIKTFEETNQHEKAQKIILDELNKAFGGAATAAADASNGQIQLSNAVGDVNEEVGRWISKQAGPFRKWWLDIAVSVGAAVKAQNDFSDAMDRTKKGQDSVSDQLVIAKKHLSDTNKEYIAITNQMANEQQMQGVISQTLRDQFEELYNKRQAQADIVDALEKQKRAEEAAAKAKAAGNAAAAAQEEANAEAALKVAEFIKERNKILDAYRDKVEEITRLESLGAVDSEKANEDRLSALRSTIDSLNALYQTDKDNSPKTREMLEGLVELYKKLSGSQDTVSDKMNRSFENANEITDANRELYNINKENVAQLEARGKTEVELLELARQQKIASIQASDADQKYKDRAIASTNELYETLKDDAAWQQFAANASNAFGAFNSVFSAMSDLVTTISSNTKDAELADLEEWYQETLYQRGLASAETIAQYEEELAKARETGDEEAIIEAEKALEKAKIDEEYNQKKAETEYKAEMSAWRMRLLATMASVAQGIQAAYSSAAAVPITGWLTAPVAAGIAATAGALNVASVVAAKPVLAYATGGIVPGSSYVGDNIPIRANSGEWILNDGQLNRLADIVFNGGSVNSEPITIITPISLDGREVARMVSRYQRNGQA